jgi:hypothetical protein
LHNFSVAYGCLSKFFHCSSISYFDVLVFAPLFEYDLPVAHDDLVRNDFAEVHDISHETDFGQEITNDFGQENELLFENKYQFEIG